MFDRGPAKKASKVGADAVGKTESEYAIINEKQNKTVTYYEESGVFFEKMIATDNIRIVAKTLFVSHFGEFI